jgi:C-terminal processing protease CtpA/Prc
MDLPASYPDEQSIKNVTSMVRRHGNLGGEVLRRFHVFFDYTRQEMLLKPARKFKDPFNYNMSGIDVGTPLPGLPYYIIADISAQSPAEIAGLKKDDQILFINGKNASEYSLNEIIELFQSKVGKKITLTVMRETKTLKATLVLKRPI